jgi:acetoin utilization deacetylase AcuC-like enzyme
MRRASVSHESSHSPTIAIVAQALRDADFGKVAVIDIDAHHGNGTQAIFYERPDVFTASVHFDPGAGWFPHHVGFADETGRDTGFGTNLNLLTSVSPP